MSEIIKTTPKALPVPSVPMTVRVGTRGDMAFIDSLQKKHSKALGFFSRKILEGYLDGGHVLIAERGEGEAPAEPGTSVDPRGSAGASPSLAKGSPSRAIGYVILRDRYLRRDELGAIFQLCVAPGYERQFIAANLLREVFERSAYGCKLYCCWCAQDLAANRFWEAMGFVPIAYRQGGLARGQGGRARRAGGGRISNCRFPIAESENGTGPSQSEMGNRKSAMPRIHIFWQKRIRAGDTSTPYWFPAKTEGGAIREDRIILPIPPGMTWTDELPVLRSEPAESSETRKAKKVRPEMEGRLVEPTKRPKAGVRFGPPGAVEVPTVKPVGPTTTEIVNSSPAKAGLVKTKADTVKPKADPMLIARARELRDRWLEQLNAGLTIEAAGKYDVARFAA